MNKYRLSIAVILVLLFSGLHAQLFHKEVNRYNDSGRKQGKWIIWWDEEEKVPMSRANYNNGHEKGVSKEYHPNGNIRLKMRYYPNDRVRVKYYNEDRELEQKGWAILEYNKKETRFYWHGKWKFFDTGHRLLRSAVYNDGEEIEEKQVAKQ